MTHAPEIVETREFGDEQVAYRIRCCGEPMTDSWHQFSLPCADMEEQLVARKARVAALHEAKVAWREKQQAGAFGPAAPISLDARGTVTVP